MNRTLIPRLACIFTLAVGAMMAGYATSSAAQKSDAEAKAKRPRLPNYYARVVTNEQRSQITSIQEEYAPQIQQKRDELQALIDKRDTAIASVLTDDQRKTIETLRAEAAARRKAASAPSEETQTDDSKAKSKSKKAA